jgi:hypothetical protein
LVLQKEQDPGSLSFQEICRYTGHNGAPRSIQDVVDEEKHRYQQMSDFVKELGDSWFTFKFEHLVDLNFTDLNAYLGFEVAADATIPSASGKAKVVRKKATGDWRHWFTEADVELFKPAYLPYMELIGYDCNDWALDPNPVIEPEFSSVYMQNLPRKATKNVVLRYLDPIIQRFK